MDALEELTGGNLTEQAKDRISKSYTSRVGERKIATTALAVKTLNDNFNKGLITEDHLEKAFKQLDGIIEKSFHKYLSRAGTPGHYKYVYLEDQKKAGQKKRTEVDVEGSGTDASLDAQADKIVQSSIDRYNDRHNQLLFHPSRLLERSVKHGFITEEQSNNEDFIAAAEEVAERWTEDQDPDGDFGSSDFTAALADFMDEAGIAYHRGERHELKPGPKVVSDAEVNELKDPSDPGFTITGEYEGKPVEFSGEQLQNAMDGAFHSANTPMDFAIKVLYAVTDQTSEISNEDMSKLESWYSAEKDRLRGRGDKEDEADTSYKGANTALAKITDLVKDWSGDTITEAEVLSVIEAADDYGVEENMFRIEHPRNQDEESRRVNFATDYITRNIPEGMWLHTMERSDVRDIVWGMVMAKRGNNSIKIFDALKKSDVDIDILKKGNSTPFVFTEEQDAFLFNVFDIMKGAPSGKIAKKVTVKKKDGGTYMATRYFSQEEIDEMETKGTTQEEMDTDTSNKIYEILEGSKAKSAQLRQLIEIGIHNPFHLMAMNTDYNESNVSHYLKEAGIDPKSFGFGKKRKAATVNDDGSIEYEEDDDEPNQNELEQEIEAMLRADGLLFDTDLMEANAETGKDAVDTVQDKFVNKVAKGEAKLAMIYGTGGVGKTWGVKQTMTNPSVKDEWGEEFGNELVEYDSELQPNSEEYDFIKFTGQISPSKLYRALYEHNGKILMLDDCDAVLQDRTMVDMLKGATDTTLEDIVWDGMPIKPTGADKDTPPLPTRFKFKGGIIFISNMTEEKLRQTASPLLDSRALSLNVSRTKEQTIDKLDRIKQHMEFEDTKGNVIEVSPESRDAAVEFVKKWSKYADIAKINARTFGSLAKDYESSKYNGVEGFLKSHSARSIMNVLDHQVKKYIYTEKKKEMKAAKDKAALMKSIHNHIG